MKNAGHEVIGSNARQVTLIDGSMHKRDARDWEKLARIARMDRLLAPVEHRDADPAHRGTASVVRPLRVKAQGTIG